MTAHMQHTALQMLYVWWCLTTEAATAAAAAICRGRPWEMVLVVYGFPTQVLVTLRYITDWPLRACCTGTTAAQPSA